MEWLVVGIWWQRWWRDGRRYGGEVSGSGEGET